MMSLGGGQPPLADEGCEAEGDEPAAPALLGPLSLQDSPSTAITQTRPVARIPCIVSSLAVRPEAHVGTSDARLANTRQAPCQGYEWVERAHSLRDRDLACGRQAWAAVFSECDELLPAPARVGPQWSPARHDVHVNGRRGAAAKDQFDMASACGMGLQVNALRIPAGGRSASPKGLHNWQFARSTSQTNCNEVVRWRATTFGRRVRSRRR